MIKAVDLTVEIIKIIKKDHNSSLKKPLNRLTLANPSNAARARSLNELSATTPFNLVLGLVGLLGARLYLQDCLHGNRRHVPTGRGRHQLLLDTTPTKMRRRRCPAEKLRQLGL